MRTGAAPVRVSASVRVSTSARVAAFARGGARAGALALSLLALARAAEAPVTYAPVVAGRALQFPQDYGSHPAFRTEWWYVTGWLATQAGKPLGFQVTFFRTRPGLAEDNPSAFAARELLIAHAALADPEHGRLLTDQKIARAGFDLAETRQDDTDVWIDRWRLARAAALYRADLEAAGFGLHLELRSTQPPLLEGDAGFSRKGPALPSASYYYSVPHLAVAGTIERQGRAEPVSGEAWLDHEWSSEYLDAQAVGWDWTGLNLDDGAALMAFRIRSTEGGTRWAAATWRAADGTVGAFESNAVEFTAQHRWRSPRTGVTYPVSMRLKVGTHELELEPLLEDQENDTRLTTGALYWEGAVRALEHGHPIGRGYLELTGYGERLRLR